MKMVSLTSWVDYYHSLTTGKIGNINEDIKYIKYIFFENLPLQLLAVVAIERSFCPIKIPQ